MAKNKADQAGEEEEEIGIHFGRRDLYRTGYFDDALPGPFDVYRGGAATRAGMRTLARGPQMTSGHMRPALFDKEFKRIFTGEVLPELDQSPDKKDKQKELGIIVPPAPSKWHSTPGDFYGCFGKQPKSFSPETKPEPELAAEIVERRLPPIKIKPPPRGGPGYLDICINRYVPMHKRYEPYDPEYEAAVHIEAIPGRRNFVSQCKPLEYFTENPYRPIAIARGKGQKSDEDKKKKPRRRGAAAVQAQPPFHRYFPRAPLGPQDGCFSLFPRYLPNPPVYGKKRKKRVKEELIKPVGGPPVRRKYTVSIVELVTRIACNPLNFPDYRAQVYPLR